MFFLNPGEEKEKQSKELSKKLLTYTGISVGLVLAMRLFRKYYRLD